MMFKITLQLSEIFQGEGEWEKGMGGDDNIYMGFNIYLCTSYFVLLNFYFTFFITIDVLSLNNINMFFYLFIF